MNGGFISSFFKKEESCEMKFGLARVIKYQELKKATNSFATELGRGGYGKVYLGKLRDGQMVAVKVLFDRDPKRLEHFFNEVTVLSRVRHKNLVSLCGCTNPTSPELLLVYEYVPNGTVAEHLRGQQSALNWAARIRIAVETAEALAYIHGLEPPIIHRDVKTSNILLDDAFHAKLADLGICRLLPWDAEHVSTLPQGTMGYRDPEYDRYFRLTDKTDVYSFGVVLMELISGQQAVDVNRDPDDIYLDRMAIRKIINHKLEEFVDPRLGYGTNNDSGRMINSVAQLAAECLQPTGNTRPSMVQLVTALKEIQNEMEQLGVNDGTAQSGSSTFGQSMRSSVRLGSGGFTEQIQNEMEQLRVNDGTSQLGSNTFGQSTRSGVSLGGGGFTEQIQNEMEQLGVNDGTSQSGSSTFGQSTRSSVSLGGGGFTEGQILEVPNLRVFTIAELKSATRNFRPDTVGEEGGFGKVFKGWVDEKTLNPVKSGSGMPIVVKRYNTERWQGLEWQSEVYFVGRLPHPNIVKLLGYCVENEVLLLAYEFTAKGSLINHLFRRREAFNPLSWDIKLKIVVGAARALAFLHTSEKPVIYWDFKTSKILLDSDYNAKLSNLGFVKKQPTDGVSYIITNDLSLEKIGSPEFIGTRGYIDPWYTDTGCLYVKSDVYGFGVVLLEMLSGRRALDMNRPRNEQNFVDGAKPFLTDRRKLARIMDPQLEGKYPLKGAFQAAQLTLKCLAGVPKDRPSMKEVVETLEHIEAQKGRERERRENS